MITPTISIPDGTYLGTITEYGLTETKSGSVTAFVRVRFEVGGRVSNLTWFGSTKTEKSRDFIVKTFKGLNPYFDNLNKLIKKTETNQDEARLIGSEVLIVIENKLNSYTNKVEAKIQYLNPTQNKFKGVTPKALSSLKALTTDFNDFDAALPIAKQNDDLPPF